jgi:hypothetical protein
MGVFVSGRRATQKSLSERGGTWGASTAGERLSTRVSQEDQQHEHPKQHQRSIRGGPFTTAPAAAYAFACFFGGIHRRAFFYVLFACGAVCRLFGRCFSRGLGRFNAAFGASVHNALGAAFGWDFGGSFGDTFGCGFGRWLGIFARFANGVTGLAERTRAVDGTSRAVFVFCRITRSISA